MGLLMIAGGDDYVCIQEHVRYFDALMVERQTCVRKMKEKEKARATREKAPQEREKKSDRCRVRTCAPEETTT